VKKFKIRSYCKINLFLRVIKKLKNGYHEIISLITFCNLYDIISISEINNQSDKITFSGNFKNGINLKSNTATQILSLLRKNKLLTTKFFKINIQKNIPHGSGLGGGSANAACILNHLNNQMKLKLNKSKLNFLASKVGSDVPLSLEKKNTFLFGKKNKFIRLNKRFKLNLLIVYPNLFCSTKKIYEKNRHLSTSKSNYLFYPKNRRKLINLLKDQSNDLEETVVRIYPKVKKIINLIKAQKGCYFSRISGSGSACIGVFVNKKNAIYAKKMIKFKHPKYWCAVSKTI
jgi:4-diphosphocytidyl-2-C-methyl-D-erythritol kinase